MLFTLGVTLLSVFLFALLPALHSVRLDLNAELKGTSRGTTRTISGEISIAVQVAFSTILLAGSILMLRTYWNLEHFNPGFDRAHIVEFSPDTHAIGYTPQQTATYFRDLQRRVSTLPGVRSLALASDGIMRGRGLETTIAPQGVYSLRKPS